MAEGFVVVALGAGVDGLHEAVDNSFDVVVLDIMLPAAADLRCSVECGRRTFGHRCSR
jgi:DNA-binding response OmpR family regulator